MFLGAPALEPARRVGSAKTMSGDALVWRRGGIEVDALAARRPGIATMRSVSVRQRIDEIGSREHGDRRVRQAGADAREQRAQAERDVAQAAVPAEHERQCCPRRRRPRWRSNAAPRTRSGEQAADALDAGSVRGSGVSWRSRETHRPVRARGGRGEGARGEDGAQYSVPPGAGPPTAAPGFPVDPRVARAAPCALPAHPQWPFLDDSIHHVRHRRLRSATRRRPPGAGHDDCSRSRIAGLDADGFWSSALRPAIAVSVIDIAGSPQPMTSSPARRGSCSTARSKLPRIARRSRAAVVVPHGWRHGGAARRWRSGRGARRSPARDVRVCAGTGRSRSSSVARDHPGVKPFHYAWDGDTPVFGSELIAVFAHPGGRCDIDPAALRPLSRMPPVHPLRRIPCSRR